jgi:iron complex outermembrane receptor protein
MTFKLFLQCTAAIVATPFFVAAAHAQTETESRASQLNEALPQDQIVVIGTRRTDRTVADSPVPIDVIGGDALVESGYTDTNRLLNQLVPSFNFPQPSLTDGTDALRPATLRGLGPDQTLVLVNGKRRHTAALLNLNGSVGRGSAAVDLNTIPPLAIERIEVLRDGAASQYGSDAIAGVINVQLKKSVGGRAQVTYGKYITTLDGVPNYTGLQLGAGGQPIIDPLASNTYALDIDGERQRRDGGTLTIAANIGLPVGPRGYLNLTGQVNEKNPTNRTGPDRRRNYALVNRQIDPRELTFDRYQHRYGDPNLSDLNFFVNGGYDVSDNVEFYTFGSYGIRDADSAGFYRLSSNSRNNNYATNPVTPFYPDGFLPLIVSRIRDVAGAAGIRGEVGDGINYDLSAVHGENSFHFFVENSRNASFGFDSQRRFDAGQLRFGQTTANLDLQKTFDVGIGDGLSVAVGAEYRRENFRIVRGDFQSYGAGPFAAPAPQAAPAGAQVFPGFKPSNEVDASRESYAGYLELETRISSMLTLQAAGRFEHFSDFGDTVNGKFAARFEPIEGFAARGSISTGFRAPSLHQQFYSTTSTNNIVGVGLVEVGTFPVSSPIAIALGAKPLQPEESLNYSGGVTFSRIPGLSITADYYNIRIDDRIVVTENLQGPDVVALLNNAGLQGGAARFFVNGLDTRTQGVEIVGSYRLPTDNVGAFNLSAGFSYNETKILNRAVLPTLPNLTLFGRVESLRITDAQPRDKINLGLTWDYDVLGFTARTNRYGKVLVAGSTPAFDQELSAKWITDLELRAKPGGNLELAVGANNVFDVYPDIANAGTVDGVDFGSSGYFLPYSSLSPFGFNGRYLYARIGVSF